MPATIARRPRPVIPVPAGYRRTAPPAAGATRRHHRPAPGAGAGWWRPAGGAPDSDAVDGADDAIFPADGSDGRDIDPDPDAAELAEAAQGGAPVVDAPPEADPPEADPPLRPIRG